VTAMGVLLDVLAPLSAIDHSVMLYVGMLSKQHRAFCQDFWALRHAKFDIGASVRGRLLTRGKAVSVCGRKRKRCHACGDALAQPWPFDPSVCICNSCTKKGGHPTYQLLSMTEAIKRYTIDWGHLRRIDQFYTSKSNTEPDGPILVDRVKFRKDDVVSLACDYYG
jgi:hypothetical protein